MKLSPAQIETLRRMAGGDEVSVSPANGSRAWVKQKNWLDRAPGATTMYRLNDLRLVEYWRDRFSITEAGRQALKEQGETP